MFCPKCGKELPDGSKFCSACGNHLADVMPEPEQQPESIPQWQPEPVPEQPEPVPERSEQTAEASLTEAPLDAPTAEIVPVKKKPELKKLIGLAVAVIAVIAVVFGGKALFSGSGGDNVYAYLSDGRYELITDLEKDQTIEIASSKSDSTMSDLLAFSPDGKYVYYFTKFSTGPYTGTLCRAEYAKLKENSSKNDKYIEIIASNVALGLRFFEDGTVVYRNNANTLYCFDGKETTQIARDVSFYTIDQSDRILYTTGDYSEGRTLYGVSLSDIDNKIKLASKCDSIYSCSDFDHILYVRQDENYNRTLYTVGFTKESEKLADCISNFYQSDDRFYFTSEQGVKLSLYDFVDDPYAQADAGITEPNADDYSVAQYSYEMLYGSNLSEESYDELYTSCTKPLYWYGERLWSAQSMENALGTDWGDNTERIHAATQSFIDQFASSADENGFIRVTDEVRAALQEIQASLGTSENEWQWLWLCYNKYQSGTSVDYEAYGAAYDQWLEVSSRIATREDLQNKENDYSVLTLYCFNNGKLTTISDAVLDVDSYYGAIAYNTTQMITEKIDLEDVYLISDVRDLLQVDRKAENYIILANGTSCRMSAAAAEVFGGSVYANLYFTDGEAYMCEDDGTLSMAEIRSGSVGDFKIVTDDAEILDRDDSTLYYASGSYKSGGVTYCDLYSCTDGTSTRLARDIMYSNINLYSDGVILAYTGYRDYSGYELTMIDAKGNATRIGDEVTQYIRVDKSTVLFISDGDLYSFDNKERAKVRNDVDWLWSKNSMQIDCTFGWNDFEYDYYD